MSKIWYKQPAEIWEEAIPLGNGKLGAMVFGKTDREEIQLNEESIWYGAKCDRINPDAYEYLPQIRQLIFDGKISEAEKLCKYALSGCPESMHPYQSLGNAFIEFDNHNGIMDYYRELDLDKALYSQHYSLDNTLFERKMFISKPADVLVMKFTAKGTGTLNFDVILRRERFFDGTYKIENNGVGLYGNLGKGGSDFVFAIMGNNVGGTLKTIGEHLIVQDAKEVTLVLGADTSYHHCGKSLDEIKDIVHKKCTDALNQGFDALLSEHEKDYGQLFNRTSFSLLCEENYDDIPTDIRIADSADNNADIKLSELYFAYGRYLLISCSREDTLPATLQGLWNKDMTPPWDSKYTININAQMNYWPAESTNLSECHMPLLKHIKTIAATGKETAQKMYGCRGFVAHHNTDIYGDSAPQDFWIPGSYWVMGGAWLCTHIYTHYEYTLDKDFLEEYYPLLIESAQFFLDFLVEKDGYLVTCPSVSPENTYILPDGTKGCISYAVTMDNQILRDLFNICIDASNVLGKNDEIIEKIKKALEKLIPTRLASDGSIMEWIDEYEEDEPGHRHISHLYGLFPSNQISYEKTPELIEGAKKTLSKRLSRGGGHTGWSRAWILNHYAMLRDGNKCFENLQKLFENSTYPNLFDKHPPFQIDGNFGVTAGIANMLCQSTADRIIILPALPDAWKNGKVSGLRVKGAGTVDIEFSDSKLSKCDITFEKDTEMIVQYKDTVKNVSFAGGQKTDVLAEILD